MRSQTMTDKLIYRRQFILARTEISELDYWQKIDVDEYKLYVHNDLQVVAASNSIQTLILLGYLFDPNNYKASDTDIIQMILENTKDFIGVCDELKLYAGRYAIIYKDENCFNIVQDALALREVYYCQHENKVICASQPNLLEHFAQPVILKSSDPDLLDFVENHLPYIRNGRLWPGDSTAYSNVKHLLPNHYLDINKLKSQRYWPNRKFNRINLSDAVAKCSTFLQGVLKAAAYRQSLMLAVTAGFDSRALLAASKEICKSVHYFINKIDRLDDRSNDIKIPKDIFRQIGLPFHIHTWSQEVPTDFRKIFFTNTALAHEDLLPVIYNIYYKQHSDKLNILGVGEVGRTKYFDPPKNLDAYYLAYMLKYRKSPYAVKECAAWLAQAQHVANQFNLNIMTLFWWEILIGNWGSVGNAESDIAIEEFDPYDSHYLYETFLSVDSKYRTFHDNILFKELIRYMWPQLLETPVNPPENSRDMLMELLQKIGIEKTARYLKFRLYKMMYQLFWANSK